MSNNSSEPPEPSPEKYLMKSVAFVPTSVNQDCAGSDRACETNCSVRAARTAV